MVGKSVMDKYNIGVNKSTVLGAGAFSGGVGGLLGKGDGSGTDRSTYGFNAQGFLNPQGGAFGHPPATFGPREDKSFVSPGGGHSHGAVSGLNLQAAGLSNMGPSTAALDNSYVMKNILNTPSSGKSKSGISE